MTEVILAKIFSLVQPVNRQIKATVSTGFSMGNYRNWHSARPPEAPRIHKIWQNQNLFPENVILLNPNLKSDCPKFAFRIGCLSLSTTVIPTTGNFRAEKNNMPLKIFHIYAHVP